MRIKSKLINILFWSVIAAAFIGPGTVTTATKAGATFGFDLLWALAFSTFACLLLQEAGARITISSGMNLGQTIAKQFEGRASKTAVLILIIGAIIIGCAAYETGNILGATVGLSLIFKEIPAYGLVLGMGIMAFIALSLKSINLIAKVMGFVVLLMGIAFITTTMYLKPDFTEILKGIAIPKLPATSGAGLIVLGLIGTTVVPYDIFLGSGVIEKKQKISDMRLGISVAVIMGGIISMAILTVGTSIEGEFSYEALTDTLKSRIGSWATLVFGFGMFAAGFSSAITAPLASALTAKSLFENENNKDKWTTQSKYFNSVWFVVLITGLFFGLINIKPIPAIILAQALNGFILPFISIFLIFVVNDRKFMKENINSWLSNILMGIVVWITLILGFINIFRALGRIINFDIPESNMYYIVLAAIALFISVGILAKIYVIRKNTGKIVQ